MQPVNPAAFAEEAIEQIHGQNEQEGRG